MSVNRDYDLWIVVNFEPALDSFEAELVKEHVNLPIIDEHHYPASSTIMIDLIGIPVMDVVDRIRSAMPGNSAIDIALTAYNVQDPENLGVLGRYSIDRLTNEGVKPAHQVG